MGYVEFIEKIFTSHGICLERINMDFIEIRLKRHYPRKLLNEKIEILFNQLKQDGRI
jgi:hypothetical protein